MIMEIAKYKHIKIREKNNKALSNSFSSLTVHIQMVLWVNSCKFTGLGNSSSFLYLLAAHRDKR